MKTRYDVPELVWNSYEVVGIESEELRELLKEEPNIWQLQDKLLTEQNRRIEITLADTCIEFIETLHEQGEVE